MEDTFLDGTHVRLRTSNGSRYLPPRHEGRAGDRLAMEARFVKRGLGSTTHRARGHDLSSPHRSAAYGRYLALRRVNAAPAIRQVCEAVLRPCDHRDRRDIQWEVILLHEASRRIHLRHI
ncbi:hypothetical protein GQ55_4G328500 [Panicum hallii var. hallii]|uniref:Uncharacterized protein n=1 Tax=Panicum hallii var. hallii TaxID=1504633 RepID=A0A2T7E2K7_9POAL|nr:hypothetical protein GQ55_4G328500 [Panicum hallii var. hallii]